MGHPSLKFQLKDGGLKNQVELPIRGCRVVGVQLNYWGGKIPLLQIHRGQSRVLLEGKPRGRGGIRKEKYFTMVKGPRKKGSVQVSV